MTDTDTVRRRFERAFDSYTQQASVQAHISQKLFQLWQQHQTDDSRRLLELGCGTGNLSRLLAQTLPSGCQIYLNDLCADAASTLSLFPDAYRTEFLHGDMQTIDLPNQLDTIISASAIQWTANPIALLHKLLTHLRPQGWLIISSFAPQHFHQFRQLTGIGLHYPDLNDYRENLKNHCSIKILKTEYHTLHFPDLLTLLRHLQQTGVSGIHANFRWGKQSLHDLQVAYQQQYGQPNGLPLTYQPLYLIAQKS